MTIQLDPRPKVYKGYEGRTSIYRQDHVMKIYDFDIHFSFSSDSQIQIERVT